MGKSKIGFYGLVAPPSSSSLSSSSSSSLLSAPNVFSLRRKGRAGQGEGCGGERGEKGYTDERRRDTREVREREREREKGKPQLCALYGRRSDLDPALCSSVAT